MLFWHPVPLGAKAAPGCRLKAKTCVIAGVSQNDDERALGLAQTLQRVSDEARSSPHPLMEGHHRQRCQTQSGNICTIDGNRRKRDVTDDCTIFKRNEGGGSHCMRHEGCRRVSLPDRFQMQP